MTLIPNQFLFRVAYPCSYHKKMPRPKEDALLDLPETSRVPSFSKDPSFATLRLGWNELGMGLQLEVTGKREPLQADIGRPRDSDGVTLWLDTRDARTSHRGSRFCHQLHFLGAGGGADGDEPAFVQTKINRALQDAPFIPGRDVLLRRHRRKSGYALEAFIPASALTGFDPEQNPRLGFYYAVRDQELGDQFLSVGSEFPYWEDPSLWSVLQLTR